MDPKVLLICALAAGIYYGGVQVKNHVIKPIGHGISKVLKKL
jgi:nucleoside permease NupC